MSKQTTTTTIPAEKGTVRYTAWVEKDGTHGYHKESVLAWSVTALIDDDEVDFTEALPVTRGRNYPESVWGSYVPSEGYSDHRGQEYETEEELLFNLCRHSLRQSVRFGFLSQEQSAMRWFKVKNKFEGGAV